METAKAIFLRDLKRLLHNPVALVVTLGVCIVPCLYAWINIIANWDPYSNTSSMPIAVVNEDKGAEVGSMGYMCVGDMLVQKLEDNDAIAWSFVDEEEALEGVRSGTYYAALVITPDFTSDLASVLEGGRTKAKITYVVNEKANAIAPKVTDAGASTIQNQIDEQFVAVVSKVIVEKLQGVAGDATTDAGEASAKAKTSFATVRTALDDVDKRLDDVAKRLRTARDAITSAANTMSGLSGTGANAAKRLDDALGDLSQTRSKANGFVSDLSSALIRGAGDATSFASTAASDVAAIAGELSYAQAQVESAIRQLENDLTDSEALKAKVGVARSLIASFTPADDASRELAIRIDRQLSDEHDTLVQITDAQTARLDELRALAERIENAADKVAALSATFNGRVQDIAGGLLAVQSDINGTLTQVNDALDLFVDVAQSLDSALGQVDPLVEQTVSVAKQLARTFDTTSNALERTCDSLEEAEASLDSLANQLATLRASEAWSLLNDLSSVDAGGVRDFMEAPVQLDKERLFPVDNYGSGIAPFFTSLAIWVGGIALVAIFKLEVDDEEVGRVLPWQAYFGRWGLFVLLGALQAIVCCTGELLIGIQCVHPWAFYLSAVVASFAFINIIFALSAAFKHIGKAIAFMLIILQVPGSAGTYPIEMMPPFFQAINPWLPFTYSNNAMREAIAGIYDGNLARCLFTLLLFVVPSILIGVTARSHLVNVNALFDRRLRDTDHLMVSEPVPIAANRFRLATVVKAMHRPDEYRSAFEERSAAFNDRYPALVRRGIVALIVVPVVLFCVMLVSDNKLVPLGLWVLSLIAIISYLIVVEFFRDRIDQKRALTDLPADELEEVLNDALREELLPVAPIDRLLQMRSTVAAQGCAEGAADSFGADVPTCAKPQGGRHDDPDSDDTPAPVPDAPAPAPDAPAATKGDDER